MIKVIRSFVNDEYGATAIEYGLIIAGLSIAILATVLLIGGDLDANFVVIQGFLS